MTDAPTGPTAFRHALDPALFGLASLERLLLRAPPGVVDVQRADASRLRTAAPVPVSFRPPLEALLRGGGVQVQVGRLERWAPEFDASLETVLDLVAPGAAERLLDVRTAIRAFSPGSLLAFHAHGEAPVDCIVGGRCVWHLLPPRALSDEEQEALHRGGQFRLPLREAEGAVRIEVGVGDAIFVPGRWPHWVEHVGPDPLVTYEVEFWTREAARLRKVYDVNWALRRTSVVRPRPPGRSPRRDAAKRGLFDFVARITGRGREFLGP